MHPSADRHPIKAAASVILVVSSLTSHWSSCQRKSKEEVLVTCSEEIGEISSQRKKSKEEALVKRKKFLSLVRRKLVRFPPAVRRKSARFPPVVRRRLVRFPPAVRRKLVRFSSSLFGGRVVARDCQCEEVNEKQLLEILSLFTGSFIVNRTQQCGRDLVS